MIRRTGLFSRIRTALSRSRVVALVGPRQCGKTTLARAMAGAGRTHYFDLEDPRSLARLAEPMTALEGLRGLVVIDEAIEAIQPDDAYFWATHQGAELDLLLFKNGRRLGIEAKRADAPALTRSMQIALEDLKLEQLVVLYPGPQRYALSDRATVVPLAMVAEGGVEALFPKRAGARAVRKQAASRRDE